MIAASICLFVVVGTGCVFESILTAGLKIANGQLNQLSANEILLLNQAVIDFLKSENPGTELTPLTPAQAQAVVTFLQANGITTPESLQGLIMDAQNGGTINGLDELAAAFAGSENQFADPDNPTQEELDALFGQAFGGNGGGGGS
jgi:hypothetical protein